MTSLTCTLFGSLCLVGLLLILGRLGFVSSLVSTLPFLRRGFVFTCLYLLIWSTTNLCKTGRTTMLLLPTIFIFWFHWHLLPFLTLLLIQWHFDWSLDSCCFFRMATILGSSIRRIQCIQIISSCSNCASILQSLNVGAPDCFFFWILLAPRRGVPSCWHDIGLSKTIDSVTLHNNTHVHTWNAICAWSSTTAVTK